MPPVPHKIYGTVDIFKLNLEPMFVLHFHQLLLIKYMYIIILVKIFLELTNQSQSPGHGQLVYSTYKMTYLKPFLQIRFWLLYTVRWLDKIKQTYLEKSL